MPNTSIKRSGELISKVAEILYDKPGGMRPIDIFIEIKDSMQLTEYELGFYPSSPDSPRFTYIIRFASIDMVKAGWLIKDQGIWFLTEAGKSAKNAFPDPEQFFKEAKRLFRVWAGNRVQNIEEDETEEQLSISGTFEQAQEKAWIQIREYLSTLSGYDFQDIVAYLLNAMEYHVAWEAPRGQDQGIDIIAYNDPLGTKPPRIKVQVKHRLDTKISAPELQQFFAVLSDDEVGLYVSSGGFTSDALILARTHLTRKITIIDLNKFLNLWIKHYSDLSYEARQKLPLKPIYYLAPEE